MNPALLVIDMQTWFFDNNPLPFWKDLLSNIHTALMLARTTKIPVIHVITRYSQDKSDWPAAWQDLDPIWCLEGTEGVQILPQARPLAGEKVVIKTRFSGFYNSHLERVLQDLAVDTLFITGYASDVCVRLTTMDAYNRGYRLFLLADCVHAEREDTAKSIAYLRWLTNLGVISNTELPELLKGIGDA